MKRKRGAKKRAGEPAPPASLKAQQQKARKLQRLVDDLERGENFNVTRLVVIKSLCQDVKTATRFTLHLARLVQKRWDWDGDLLKRSVFLRELGLTNLSSCQSQLPKEHRLQNSLDQAKIVSAIRSSSFPCSLKAGSSSH
jgi:hypothetical protein